MNRTRIKHVFLLVFGVLLLALIAIPAGMSGSLAMIPNPVEPVIDDGGGDDSGNSGGGGGGGSISGDPLLVKYAYPERARVGDHLEFIIDVYNYYGRSDDVMVFDTVNPCYEIVRATTSWGNVYINANQVTVDIGKLFRDDFVEIHILTTVACDPGPENWYNTATLTADSSKDELYNNMSTVWFEIDSGQPQPVTEPEPISEPQPDPNQGETGDTAPTYTEQSYEPIETEQPTNVPNIMTYQGGLITSQ